MGEGKAGRSGGTAVRRLHVLLCGYEILPKTVSTRDRGGRFILAEPVCAYLLDTDRGWVLLDTGVDPGYSNDPLLRETLFLANGWSPPVVRPAHLLEAQLETIGVTCTDIGHVILSHLHYDHCAGLARFAHARISIQRSEYAWGFGGAPGAGYLLRDYGAPRLDWDLHDGDWEAMPGLALLDTRGHTAGHQSAMIDLPSGKAILLPFDAGDLAENFETEVLPGECHDEAAALAAIRRLNALRTEHDAEMLLFHDPVAIQAMRLAPDCYD
ncbi:N-acyl homoserine lactonase family protein [Flavisphingomonas formosensis]|uniref:N-acyl homoserine lactonase family protein n=1 Tax=Flavisphingomonas formosensis TaxID=861534 RepID=UPI0012F7BFA6|nr:N-acyl homoserine lactonase family protein [Sphingomonas formosensis]